MSEHNIEVDKDALIVKLSLENLALEKELALLKIRHIQKEIKLSESEKELREYKNEESIPKKEIGEWACNQLRFGKIPLPKIVTGRSFVEVTCDPNHEIKFVHGEDDCYRMRINFKSNGFDITSVDFELKLAPMPHQVYDALYGEFHYGFEKQKPEVVAKPKPSVKKKAEPKTKPAKPTTI